MTPQDKEFHCPKPCQYCARKVLALSRLMEAGQPAQKDYFGDLSGKATNQELTTEADKTYFAVVCSSSMNNLGPFGLLAIAVGVAALFVLVGAIPVLVVRNLITRRPVATHLREWLLYVLGAAFLIIAFVSCFLYAKHKGIDEYTTVKWMNIFITAAIVFGPAAKKFWRLRTKWTFWAALCVLTVGHFAFLSRLHWQKAGYFWLPVVVGIPELAFVIFVLGLAFDPHGNLTKPESW